MKINKNELHSMINQIDDDLLREAQEGYGREKSHMMQRIIPVAACILIMISGIVGAALKNGVVDQTDSASRSGSATSATETVAAAKDVKTIDIAGLSVQGVLEKLDTELDEPENLIIISLAMELSKDVRIMNGSIEVRNTLTEECFKIILTEKEAVIRQEDTLDMEFPVPESDQEAVGLSETKNWSAFAKTGAKVDEAVKSYMDSYDMVELTLLLSQEELVSETADIYLDGAADREIEISPGEVQGYTSAIVITGKDYEDTVQLDVMLLY